MKSLTRSMLCAITGAYLVITGSVIAGADKDVQVIKVLRDKDNVTVHMADGLRTDIPKEALSDKDALLSYLGDLDEKTQELIVNLLSGMGDKEGHHQMMDLAGLLDSTQVEHRKVIVVGKEHIEHEAAYMADHQIHMDADVHVSPDVLVTKLKDGHHIAKHIFVDIDDAMAHQKTIISLLQKGDYTQEQLDDIQQALDSKR